MYTIYALVDPRDQSVHYIGQSKEAYRRYAMHLLNVARTKTEKDLWIQNLREEGVAPVITLLEEVETKKEAIARETHWIKHYLAMGAPLKNAQQNHVQIAPKKKDAKQSAGWTEEEEKLRQLLKEHGWSLLKRQRGDRNFFYALKWKQGQIYLSSETKLSELTKERVLEKIGVTPK